MLAASACHAEKVAQTKSCELSTARSTIWARAALGRDWKQRRGEFVEGLTATRFAQAPFIQVSRLFERATNPLPETSFINENETTMVSPERRTALRGRKPKLASLFSCFKRETPSAPKRPLEKVEESPTNKSPSPTMTHKTVYNSDTDRCSLDSTSRGSSFRDQPPPPTREVLVGGSLISELTIDPLLMTVPVGNHYTARAQRLGLSEVVHEEADVDVSMLVDDSFASTSGGRVNGLDMSVVSDVTSYDVVSV